MKTTVETHPKNDAPRPEEYVLPEVNIFESNEGYILEAEMPGVNKSGLQISVEGTEITITGRRNAETVSGDWRFRERSNAAFRRVFNLDPAIDTARISAKMEQGVLTLTLPRSERAKPRRITVD